jgi:hypothetical protein
MPLVVAVVAVMAVAAFMAAEVSMAEAAFTVVGASMAVEASTAGDFTAEVSMPEVFTAADFMAAAFMPFALHPGQDATSARAAPNSTPPVPAMRTFRKAGSRKAQSRTVWSQAATPTQAV